MAAIDTIYNYYLSTYGSTTSNRYDTHKKSELRSVYNNMIKVNKESPIYKILGADTGEASRYVIDVKESSMQLSKVAASLSDENNSLNGSFKKKVASSSNPSVVSVTYVGDYSSTQNLEDSFDLEVKQLAGEQVNIGHYLEKSRKDLQSGQYSFDFENNATAYEFQFGVSDSDTNFDIQNKLARLINTANVGATAYVDEDEEGRSSLTIKSKETGLAPSEKYLFQIKPYTDFASQEAIKILGIDHVSKEAQNSAFLLNGTEHNSLANTFTINKEFEITLHAVSEEGKPAQIGFANDVDAIADNVSKLVNSYNQAIDTVSSYSNSAQQSGKLLHDLSSLSFSFRSDLESMGLMVQEDAKITIDRATFDDAVTNDLESNVFNKLNSFKNAVATRAASVSINPVNYVNKVVVAYKNPGRGFNTPYSTSIYAGMMLDRYC